MTATLPRRLLAEFLGTALLVAVVVGSGIMATTLSPGDPGLQLLENSLATALGLAVLIVIFSPISGAHFNPVVSLADWWIHRGSKAGLPGLELPAYAAIQTLGAITGAILANLTFGLSAVSLATQTRSGGHLLLGETVATAGLILLIVALVRTGRTALAAPTVGAYIGAAYWFTSSTSFANPAVTIGRAFTDTFTGINLASVPAFIAFQLLGGLLGLAAALTLYPSTTRTATEAINPALVPAQPVESAVPEVRSV